MSRPGPTHRPTVVAISLRQGVTGWTGDSRWAARWGAYCLPWISYSTLLLIRHLLLEGRPIRWLQDGEGKCLQVNPPGVYAGQTLGVFGCLPGDSGSIQTQRFVYNIGSTKIRTIDPKTGQDFCVDFGNNLGTNEADLTIQASADNPPGQQLYITDDNHIAVGNGPGQCANVRAESGEPIPPYGIQKILQSWQCEYGNTNQATEDVYQTRRTAKFQIFTDSSHTAGSTQIRMIDSSDGDVVCVDFGSNPANGGRITTETCDDDATGQRLYTTDDDHIAMENGPGQCMDVQAESGPLPIRLYGVLKSIQNWACALGNPNQVSGFAGR
ncbi:hypothetical protein QFC20_003658 [Naganishia adeliensis]|uniref:Uncharacterized protein n=1 Tax=Naganishia adeliensis TaxID=92952 RepID=A0ACC2W979_9TREE|nr:hypothetical protein QFC20_003658 [Naganishia adeliensis]